MRIILERNKTNSVEISTDAETITEVMCEIYNVLIAFGFRPDTVKAGFIEKAEELEE